MSEYIEVEYEPTDDPDVVLITTNLNLTPDGGPEVYHSAAEGDEGSPLALAIFVVPGVVGLTLNDGEILLRRDPDTPWYDLIEDVRDALRDFFL
jgi:hypothetical protein